MGPNGARLVPVRFEQSPAFIPFKWTTPEGLKYTYVCP